MEILGIDIGGSGIKGAPVNIKSGELTADRHRIPTPQPSVPEAVTDVVADIVRHFKWSGPIGCTFPAIIKQGVAYSAANVDDSWIGTNGQQLIEQKTDCPVLLLNDADAAGWPNWNLARGVDAVAWLLLITLGNRHRYSHFCGWSVSAKYRNGAHRSARPGRRRPRRRPHSQKRGPVLEKVGAACK